MKDTGISLKLGSWREWNWLTFIMLEALLELGEFLDTLADVESGSLLYRIGLHLHAEQAQSLSNFLWTGNGSFSNFFRTGGRNSFSFETGK